jgi:beta-glucosidase-like glycosyl hydrolase
MSTSIRRGRSSRRPRPLGDERLQRARRHPVRRRADVLTTILRGQWGFEGCVVSDYFSIRQLADTHRFAVDAQDAAAKALDAGMDVELPSSDCYAQPLSKRSARVSSLPRRSTWRSAACCGRNSPGLFEQPFVDTSKTSAASDTAAHRELARKIARKNLCSCATTARCRSRRTAVPSRDRTYCRQRPQPLRRLRVPGPCRVDPGR